MADQKLSQLTALTNANLGTDDLILVTDTGAAASKSMTIGELDKRYNRVVSEYSSAQSLDTDDQIVIGDTTSAGFTITLPSAASYSGKQYKIMKKYGLTDFNKLTVSDGGSFSTFLYGAGESVTVVSDGSVWIAVEYSDSEIMTYVPTISNCDNIVTNSSRVYFHKEKYHVMSGYFELNGAGTTAAAISVSVPFASIDTANLSNGTSTSNQGGTQLGGAGVWFDTGNAWLPVYPRYASSTTFIFAYSTQLLFGSQLASGDSVQYPGVIIPIGS